MKKPILTLALLASIVSFAQSPNAFNYQAIARDASGEPLVLQPVGLQFLIHQTTAGGTVVYAESHASSTDDKGLLTLEVGNGTPSIGTMVGIDWSAGPYFLEVRLDPAGGTAYTSIGTQQLLSVPYAKYAEGSGDWSLVADTLHSDGKWVGIGTASPDALLEVNGGDMKVNGIRIGRGQSSAASTAVGDSVLANNLFGDQNTAIGNSVLKKLIQGSFNTGVGHHSLSNSTFGNNNTAVGAYALEKNSSSQDLTAVGYGALRNDSLGLRNTAVGSFSLYNNGEGISNSAFGYAALAFNTEGYANTAVGHEALRDNTTGFGNTAINLALVTNSTGSSNVAIGNNAMLLNETGNNNVAVGSRTLWSTGANNNVALGYEAGINNQLGNGNTYLGYKAGPSASSSYAWSTAIGENSTVMATDQIRIGTSFTASIGGFQAWSNLSDARMKKNVTEEVPGLDLILKLRPVSYQLDHEALIRATLSDPEQVAERLAQIPERASNALETGFIAQEVEAAAKALGIAFSGVDAPKNSDDLYGLRYASFVVPLVKAVQEQQAMIEELRSEIIKLKADRAGADR